LKSWRAARCQQPKALRSFRLPYEAFKASTDGRATRMPEACLQFAQDPDPARKQIAENTKMAPRRIASESRINALRILNKFGLSRISRTRRIRQKREGGLLTLGPSCRKRLKSLRGGADQVVGYAIKSRRRFAAPHTSHNALFRQVIGTIARPLAVPIFDDRVGLEDLFARPCPVRKNWSARSTSMIA
jgi:hypothetical protein